MLREKQTSSKQTNPTFDPKWKKVVATGICLVVNQLSVKYTFGMLEFYFEIPQLNFDQFSYIYHNDLSGWTNVLIAYHNRTGRR